MNLSEVQIDVSALRHNATQIRTLLPDRTKMIAVVKSNAYGHGVAEIVTAIEDLVEGFQVDDIEELRELRRFSTKRCLVLGYVQRSALEEAVELGAELTIYDSTRVHDLEEIGLRASKRPKVHLKIDTLLGRQGILPSELAQFLNVLKACQTLDVVAIYSHFANIEDTTDLTHANAQVEIFEQAYRDARASGWPNLGRHLSATSGLMVMEQASAPNDLVRIGIGLYGMYPSVPLSRRHEDLKLAPIARWVSHLAQVKRLPPGHPVGYGLTYVAWREMIVGIVPQGYGDGYDRGFSSSGEVLVGGIRCPVIGRVAMNMFAIDLTHAPSAKPEDEVVLLGAQGEDRITAEEMGARLGTINYEIVARISPLLPRVAV